MHLTLDLLKKKREAGMGVVLRCPYTTHRTNNEDIKGCTQALARASARRQCCVLGQQLARPSTSRWRLWSIQGYAGGFVKMAQKFVKNSFVHNIFIPTLQPINQST